MHSNVPSLLLIQNCNIVANLHAYNFPRKSKTRQTVKRHRVKPPRSKTQQRVKMERNIFCIISRLGLVKTTSGPSAAARTG